MTGAHRAAVLGSPIRHSLSPAMHRAAYAALGLDGWRYDAIELGEDEAAGFVAGCGPEWAGLSVTMPLKRVVRDLLVAESELATAVGAVNTMVRTAAGWHGHNTDVHGIVQALTEIGADRVGSAVVLGGGATAASTLAALRELGCRRTVVAVRSAERARPLLEAAERLGVRVDLTGVDAEAAGAAVAALGEHSAVVCTVPGAIATALAADLVAAGPGRRVRGGTAGPTLLDVVYDPWPTPLAAAWAAAGGACAGGFAMLVHQAEGQVRLMTGRRVDVEVLRRAGQEELDRRSGLKAGG